MRVQTFLPEFTIEHFNERIIGRFAKPREVERHVVGIGPQIQNTGDKFAAIVDSDRV